jgi:phosphatidate cytidylyltransferase
LKDLGRRTVVSLISITLATLLVVFAYSDFIKPLVLAFLALLSGIATWEYVQLAQAKGGTLLSRHLVVFAALLTLSFALSGIGSVVVVLVALFVLFGLHFKEFKGSIIDLALSSFGLLYVAVPLGMLLAILYSPGERDGRIWIAYLIAVTKLTDMGAYFGGQLLGRNKLAQAISPSKTIEGALSGLVVALLVSYLFYFLGTITLIEAIVLGLVLGLLGQFGDLAESMLKRDAKKKDSNTLPGLGGVLDTVDSLLFTAPVLFCYLSAT